MHKVLGNVANEVDAIVQKTLEMEELLNAHNGKHALLMLQANLGHGQFVLHQDEPGDPWHEKDEFHGGGPLLPPPPPRESLANACNGHVAKPSCSLSLLPCALALAC